MKSMGGMNKRRAGELVRAVFKALLPHEEGLPVKEVLRQVEDALSLTPYEESVYPNRPGVRRFDKIIRFTTIAQVKAGWLIKDKGMWSLTDAGRRAYQQYPDAEAFQGEANRLYDVWAGARPTEEIDEESSEPSTNAATTLEEASDEAWESLESYVREMQPYAFQDLVAALLRGMGYHVAWVAEQGADGGIDIVAYNDPLGTKMPRIKVQVKRRQDRIGVEEVRSFMAVLGDQDVGLFVSTGGFTKEAQNTARTKESQQLTLLNLKELLELWVDHYDKLKEEDRMRLPLRPIYYLDIER